MGSKCVLTVHADDKSTYYLVITNTSFKVFNTNIYLRAYFLYDHLPLTSLTQHCNKQGTVFTQYGSSESYNFGRTKMDTKQKIFLDANKIDTVIYTVSQKTRH